MTRRILETTKPTPKHVLSKLRKVIGASLSESRVTLGLSPHTVQSIQSGRLRFSGHAAGTVSQHTGVSVAWLLGDDRHKQPVAMDGTPYTRETFDRYEASRDNDGKARALPENMKANAAFLGYQCRQLLRSLVVKLGRIMLAGYASGKTGFVFWRLEKEIQRLAKVCPEFDSLQGFEFELRKQVDGMNADQADGLLAIFERFRAELAAMEKKRGGKKRA
jgi:hypothetical protein